MRRYGGPTGLVLCLGPVAVAACVGPSSGGGIGAIPACTTDPQCAPYVCVDGVCVAGLPGADALGDAPAPPSDTTGSETAGAQEAGGAHDIDAATQDAATQDAATQDAATQDVPEDSGGALQDASPQDTATQDVPKDTGGGGSDSGGQGGSCAGRCDSYDESASCQCDSFCVEVDDCCDDYKALCTKPQCASAKDCDDANPCTADACKAGACVNNAAPDGSPCDDGKACSTNDACTGGQCSGGGKKCDDGNPCTTDGCDDAKGCVHLNNTAKCDDGDPCTDAACKGGKCVGAPKPAGQCDDGSQCTADTCVPGKGCVHTPNPKACDDGDPCTTDGCTGGKCTHLPIPGCCVSGVCCDASAKKMRPKYFPCTDTPFEHAYMCGETGRAYRRGLFASCTGTSASECSKWLPISGPWMIWKICDGTKVCAKAPSAQAKPFCKKGTSCSYGVCCDTKAKIYKSANAMCGTTPLSTKYRCFQGHPQYRQTYAACGNDPTQCSSGTTHDTGWLALAQCPSGTTCTKTAGGGVTCATPSGGKPKQCTSGVCCDLATNQFRPQGYMCGTQQIRVEHRCIDAANAESRSVYAGCSGFSATCSASPHNQAFSEWIKYLLCPTSAKTCRVLNSSKSPICYPAKSCKSGTCCNPNLKVYEPLHTKCGSTALETQRRCHMNKVQRRRKYAGCDPGMKYNKCTTAKPHWTHWEDIQSCGAGQVCKEYGHPVVASCVANAGVGGAGGPGIRVCDAGLCCNLLTGRYRSRQEKCSTSPTSYEYRCATAGGKVVQRRAVYKGCSGFSTGCSSDAKNAWREPWSTYQSCGVGEHCVQSSSSSSPVAKCTFVASTGACVSGACCDAAAKYVKPRFTQCSTKVLETRYKCSADGRDALKQSAYRGCTGSTTGCTDNPSSRYWSPWKVVQHCTAAERCLFVGFNAKCVPK